VFCIRNPFNDFMGSPFELSIEGGSNISFERCIISFKVAFGGMLTVFKYMIWSARRTLSD
jgi:hypothetical protein